MELISIQRVTYEGRTFEVHLYAAGSGQIRGRVSQLTKKGPRTLYGRGRAYRAGTADAVTSIAISQAGRDLVARARSLGWGSDEVAA